MIIFKREIGHWPGREGKRRREKKGMVKIKGEKGRKGEEKEKRKRRNRKKDNERRCKR
ncbi:hypothetical protein COCNU_16G000870 [Cocos nucifera]|uniref:Uncharacterized protein n=1 Tax=Cocos nucifera TaxID=13894 RepID=A0A8K0IZI0_COCNU|nr:hypothetical protein COCNU_16G000870 [Cocos nucifera]